MESISRQPEQTRDAFDRREWDAAHARLTAARTTGLDAGDLWRLALASFLTGREQDFTSAAHEAHQAYLDAARHGEAFRCAFWLGLHLAERGETGQATGWLGRAARLVERIGPDCVERGYLLVPQGKRALVGGDIDAACAAASEATALGQRFGDADLVALALHLHGRALLRAGRVEPGLALLDEAMVAVTADELSPQVTGLIYCSVIGACREVWAVGRAHEWTGALTDWCERQPDMVAYTGECRVYRAEVLRMRGEWRDAMEEARRASERFAQGSIPDASGLAHYEQAEVHRLRGELEAAEEAYRAASRAGREPQPGLALLRLAQGEGDTAAAAIRRALVETGDPIRRARLLPAAVEIMLETGDVEEARRACNELASIAESCATGVLGTVLESARGAIALAAGDPSGALSCLRRASREWQALNAPYEAARTRVLLGLACRELGDEDGADLELEAARAVLERLGAAHDIARLEALTRERTGRDDHGLTRREREVLALVATGMSNRAISDELSISPRTVERHVANIFGKLGLSTRAAATAWAYEHGLVRSSA